MRKIVNIILTFIVVLAAFFITDRAVYVSKMNDPIMQEINKITSEFYEKPFDAYVLGENEIIPGYNGLEVDTNKSYYAMKGLGKFDIGLLVLKETVPGTTIWDAKERLITQGNPLKKNVSIVFYIDSNDDVNDYIKLLKKHNLTATFFLTKEWIDNHRTDLMKLYINGNEIGLNVNKDSSLSEIKYLKGYINNLIIKTPQFISVADYSYNKKLIKNCDESKIKLVIPNIKLDEVRILTVNTITLELMKKMQAGAIMSVPINNNGNRILANIKKVASDKGLKITNLNIHLSSSR